MWYHKQVNIVGLDKMEALQTHSNEQIYQLLSDIMDKYFPDAVKRNNQMCFHAIIDFALVNAINFSDLFNRESFCILGREWRWCNFSSGSKRGSICFSTKCSNGRYYFLMRHLLLTHLRIHVYYLWPWKVM